MFNRQPTETQFIFLTLVLALLGAIPTVSTLLAPEGEQPQLRQPASIAPGASAETNRGTPETSSLAKAKYDLHCQTKLGHQVEVRGDLLQLQGRTCSGRIMGSPLEIENQSNGYTASVFESEMDQYQTDLIQLQKGSNKILIKYRDSSGKPVEERLLVQSEARP